VVETVEVAEAAEWERERDRTWELVLARCMEDMREYERREWLIELHHQDALRNERGGATWTRLSARRRELTAQSAASFSHLWEDLSGLDYIE